MQGQCSAPDQLNSNLKLQCPDGYAIGTVYVCVMVRAGGADPSGNLGLVPRWMTGHLYLVRPCKGETTMRGTRSLLPERVKGTNVRETVVSRVFLEYRRADRRIRRQRGLSEEGTLT